MSRRLDDVDLTQTMSSLESQPRIASAQKRLLHLRLFSAGLLGPAPHAPGLVVLFEGFDAAGKGGAIRRLTAGLDSRHVRVVPITTPPWGRCATTSSGASPPRCLAKGR